MLYSLLNFRAESWDAFDGGFLSPGWLSSAQASGCGVGIELEAGSSRHC
mgnify:CR=1 FL=1